MNCPIQYVPAEQDKGIDMMTVLSILFMGISLVSACYLAKYLKSMSNSVWWIECTQQKMLDKLTFIERREMRAKLRCHELMRTLGSLLHEYNPQCDETYLLRHFSSEIGQFFEARRESLWNNKSFEELWKLLQLILRCLYEQEHDTAQHGYTSGLSNLMKVKMYEQEYFKKTGQWPWGYELLTEQVCSVTPESMQALRSEVVVSVHRFELFQLQQSFAQVPFSWKR
jgi:hypothetical protein